MWFVVRVPPPIKNPGYPYIPPLPLLWTIIRWFLKIDRPLRCLNLPATRFICNVRPSMKICTTNDKNQFYVIALTLPIQVSSSSSCLPSLVNTITWSSWSVNLTCDNACFHFGYLKIIFYLFPDYYLVVNTWLKKHLQSRTIRKWIAYLFSLTLSFRVLRLRAEIDDQFFFQKLKVKEKRLQKRWCNFFQCVNGLARVFCNDCRNVVEGFSWDM